MPIHETPKKNEPQKVIMAGNKYAITINLISGKPFITVVYDDNKNIVLGSVMAEFIDNKIAFKTFDNEKAEYTEISKPLDYVKE